MLTSSGQAATLTAVLTIAKAGDHILCSSTVYGGTFNLMAVTFKRMGIDVTFFEQSESDEEIEAKIQENTKAVFGETIANPALTIFDIERFAKLAHKHHLPLIVDNTFATPCLCKPFEFGADIVVHSTTKYLDGHAVQVGGCVVDSGNLIGQVLADSLSLQLQMIHIMVLFIPKPLERQLSLSKQECRSCEI